MSSRRRARPAPEKSATAALELERFLPYRLNVLADLVSQSLSKVYARVYGLSVAEWRIIATLGQFEAMTAAAIGAHSHMHKTKVSRAVATLTKRGLISRTSDSDDLRAAILRLTTAGREVYDNIVPDALDYTERLTEGLDADQQKLLNVLIDRLIERSRTLVEENPGA